MQKLRRWFITLPRHGRMIANMHIYIYIYTIKGKIDMLIFATLNVNLMSGQESFIC